MTIYDGVDLGSIEIRNEKNQIVNTVKLEKWEQMLAKKYIQPDDVVLELGARYGSVSCNINKKLAIKTNQVSVEPDKRVWRALEENRRRNHCGFHIVKGFVSRKKLDLTNLDEWFNGYGATAVENNNSNIPSYTVEEIEEKYGLHFNVLVIDCEGCLESFFDENPTILDQIRMVMFEADYPEKCDYAKIKKLLHDNGFRMKHNVYDFQYVYLKKESPDKATSPLSEFEKTPKELKPKIPVRQMRAFIDVKPTTYQKHKHKQKHSQRRYQRFTRNNNNNNNNNISANKTKIKSAFKKKQSHTPKHVSFTASLSSHSPKPKYISPPVRAMVKTMKIMQHQQPYLHRRKRCPNGTRKDKNGSCQEKIRH